MKILLIEDDLEIVRSLSLALRAIDFNVATAIDGEQGLSLALKNSYDIVILDYNLPQLNGQEVLRKIKNKKPGLPIIMLTVRSEIDDKVKLLNHGADDYLTKPFSLSELVARIKTILRRPNQINNKKLKIDDLELNPETMNTTVRGKEINLTSKEFALLQYLMENKGKVLSRQEIIEHIWDDRVDPFSNTIEVHIMRLRQKINNKKRQLISTCSNRGYKIVDRQ